MKAGDCISDVVTGPQTVDKTSCCVEYRLELADQICQQTDQYTITVVRYHVYQRDHQHLELGRQYRTVNLTKSA